MTTASPSTSSSWATTGTSCSPEPTRSEEHTSELQSRSPTRRASDLMHFSLFGSEFIQRMITQMYFPGDPLFALDPIYQSITDRSARDRLVATYDHSITEHEFLMGYNWDIVLTGAN